MDKDDSGNKHRGYCRNLFNPVFVSCFGLLRLLEDIEVYYTDFPIKSTFHERAIKWTPVLPKGRSVLKLFALSAPK